MMVFGAVFNDVILCINMKKLIESGKCNDPIRDCIAVIAPMAWVILPFVLFLIFIR